MGLYPVSWVYAQYNSENLFDINKMIPTSPESAILGRFGDIPVSHYSGTADISVPLYTVTLDDIQIPIVLRYHGSGIKVEDQAGLVGLGWSLEPGGAIIQAVNGRSDLEGNFYNALGTLELSNFRIAMIQGFHSQRQSDLYWSGAVGSYESKDTWNIFDRLKAGQGQPDVFQFHLPGGHSGKFFFNWETGELVLMDKRQDITIERDFWNTWTITTLDGHKFLFGLNARETAEEFGFPENRSNTWRLHKVVSSSGRTVDFTYSSGTYTSFSYNESFRSPYPISYPGAGDVFHKQVGNTTHNVRYLRKILSTDVTVDFHLEDRHDMMTVADNDGIAGNGALAVKRLKSIDISSTKSMAKIKSFNFGYDYFAYNTLGGSYVNLTGGNTQAFLDQMGKRLKLLSVTEVGYNNSGQAVNNKPFLFSYDESVTMPMKSSFARDYWGYFNGKNNDKLIVDPSFFFYSGHVEYANMPLGLMDYTAIQGSNRSPDSTKSGAYLLKRITYPTGGFSEFDYEPHKFSNYSYPDQNRINSTGVTPSLADKNQTADTRTHTFTLQKTMSIRFNSYIGRGGTSLTFDQLFPSTIKLTRWVGSSSTVLKTWQMNLDQRNEFNANGVIYFDEIVHFPHQAGATYVVTVDLADGVGQQSYYSNTASAGCSFKYYTISSTDYMTNFGGGMRIKQIRNHTTEGLATSKFFKYLNEDNSSSGVLMSPLNYLYPDEMHFLQRLGPLDALFFKDTIWMVSSDSYVPISNGGFGSAVGYSRVEELARSPTEAGNGRRVFHYHNQASITKARNPDDPHPLNGKISKEEVFNAVGASISESNYFYVIRQTTWHNGFKIFSNYIGNLPNDFTNDPIPWSIAKHYDLDFYPINGRWCELRNKTTKLTEDGTSITKTENYTYNIKGQLVKTEFNDSQSKKVTTQWQYPVDTTGAEATALRSAGLHSHLLKQTQLLNDDFVSASRWKYSVFPSQTTVPVVQRIERNYRGGGWFTEVDFKRYGSYNTPLELEEDGLTHAFLWNDTHTAVLAVVKNGLSAHLAFTSFEDQGKGQWVYSGVTTADSTSPTGRRAYNLNGNPVSKTGMESGYKYILTYWAKSEAAGLISGAAATPVRSRKGWTQYRRIVTSVTSLTLSGNYWIDDIRLHPAEAEMSSFTYDPLIGLTSEADAAGNIRYYEYDAFHRLSTIRDLQGNIVEDYKYNYRTP